jgi:hypothetical protein
VREFEVRCERRLFTASTLAIAILLLSACHDREQPRVDYVPLTQIEQSYGQLITVSNAPTPNQNGTGDRLGLFRDKDGTIWGIPLTENNDRGVLGCAPPNLKELPITDTLPADVEIVGAANEPTAWRGGTGKLELLLRDSAGTLRWHPVAAAEVKNGPVCWSQSEPVQTHRYYRLVKAGSDKVNH